MRTKECNKKTKFLFPEYREIIQQLREENPYFAKLFEDHEILDKEIIRLELDPIPSNQQEIEVKKRKKLKLKDEMYRLVKIEADGSDIPDLK